MWTLFGKLCSQKIFMTMKLKWLRKKNGKLILLNKNVEEIVTVILWTNNFKQMQKGRRIVIIAAMLL